MKGLKRVIYARVLFSCVVRYNGKKTPFTLLVHVAQQPAQYRWINIHRPFRTTYCAPIPAICSQIKTFK